MTHSRLLQLLALSASLTIPACMADPGDETDAADDGTLVHVMPMTSPDKVVDAAPMTGFGCVKIKAKICVVLPKPIYT